MNKRIHIDLILLGLVHVDKPIRLNFLVEITKILNFFIEQRNLQLVSN